VVDVALGSYSPYAIAATAVLLILTGALVPRWIFNRIINDKDKLIDRLTRALDKRDEQFDILIKQGELSVRLLEDLKAAGKAQEVRHP
jgi:hypothetical protein